MSARAWSITVVMHVAWWAWTLAWGALYIWNWGNNPLWYTFLLAVSVTLGVVMIGSWRRSRKLRLDMIQREASLQDDLRVAIQRQWWLEVDHTLVRMKIWNVTPAVPVPPHPGPEDDSYWVPPPV